MGNTIICITSIFFVGFFIASHDICLVYVSFYIFHLHISLQSSHLRTSFSRISYRKDHGMMISLMKRYDLLLEFICYIIHVKSATNQRDFLFT